MKTPHAGLLAAPVLAAALSVATPLSARAQSMTEGWQFGVALYGWFPAIDGTTSFPPHGGGPEIEASTGDVLDALKFAFFGTFEARNGPWGLWTDVAYADLGGSKQHSRDITIGGGRLPLGVNANLSLDIKTWIWTLAGLYNLKSDAEGIADLLFGARLLDMTNTLDWTLSADVPQLPDRKGSGEASLSNWDAVVGLKGRFNVGEERKWFIPYYVDVGTGESKLTWQIQAGAGYQFDWGAVVATWRYLDYDFKDSSKIQSMSMNGPTIGVVLKF
jgi:hypothetical protein